MSQVDYIHPKDPADTDQTDADGNTLFHRAALGSFDDESLAELTERAAALHVNADQPNHAGRTPLHVLCCYDWYDDMSPRGSGYTADPIRHFYSTSAMLTSPIHGVPGPCTWSPYCLKYALGNCLPQARTRRVLHLKA